MIHLKTVVEIHSDLIGKHGGSKGIRSIGSKTI
jgi:hypothetical protein